MSRLVEWRGGRLCGGALALTAALFCVPLANSDAGAPFFAFLVSLPARMADASPHAAPPAHVEIVPPDIAPRLSREVDDGGSIVLVRVNRAAKSDLAMSIAHKTPPPETPSRLVAPVDPAPALFADDGAAALKRGFLRKLPVVTARLDPRAPLAPAQASRPEPARLADLSIASTKDLERAHACLTQAIYHESRGEPVRGQQAVAQVVLNRVKSGVYPTSICGVIFQNQHWRNRCQFSFACDGTKKRVHDQQAWETATRIADDAIAGRYFLQEIGDATHYHAAYVAPRWRRSLQRMKKIGEHIFYAIPGVAINDE